MGQSISTNSDHWFIPIPEKPTIMKRSIGKGMVGISRIRHDKDGLGCFDKPAIEDAVLLSHHLSNFHSEIRVNGKLVQKPRFIAGLTTIHDFRQDIECNMISAFDTVTFHIPRLVMETVFPDSHGVQFDDLNIQPSGCVSDPTIAAIGKAVLPVLEAPDEFSMLFLDHISHALITHFVSTYGTLTQARAPGRLAPWQEKRAKDIINSRLDGEVCLADIAAECRLSIGHFVRAFRRTTNTTPHQWLLQRRVEHAQKLMLDTQRTLADISLDCGFADQSHFTRTFRRLSGTSPGGWRRHHGKGQLNGDHGHGIAQPMRAGG